MDSTKKTANCRYCLAHEPEFELIRPCNCFANETKYAHRHCLDRWRVISPYPDAMTHCEVCKTPYQIIQKEKENDCWDKTTVGLLIAMDILAFFAAAFAMYLLWGFLGDLAFNNALKTATICSTGNKTHPCGVYNSTTLFYFTLLPLWEGRIWFWGFIVFFFILGFIGCCFMCAKSFSSKNSTYDEGYSNFHRNDCYWCFCGPTYYNHYYYGSPYGYWGDWNCFWCCICCTNINCPSCDCDCDKGCDCDCSGGNDSGAILIIVAVIVLIFVAIGVAFGVCVTFIVVNKIVKRHLDQLNKKKRTVYEVIVDLDTPEAIPKGYIPPNNLHEDSHVSLEISHI